MSSTAAKENKMRELTGHKVNPANDLLTVEAMDGPGPGGASHNYRISWPNNTRSFEFQDGPIAEVGVNGITHEAVLAVLIDRLEGFQSGPFANEYNERALDNLKTAQALLQKRTRERMERGVEGTHKP